jgi:hypothetical protein
MKRTIAAAGLVALAALLAVALWFRVSSLARMPSPDADEAWYPVQVDRLLHGARFEKFTPNGNPINPVFPLFQIPFLLAGEPAFWQLRIIAAGFGVLGVALAYLVGRRVLDGPTAVVAAVGLAVLPVAVIYSRIAFELCQSPAIALACYYCAFRAKRAGLVLSLAAAYIFHPTNIFVLSAVLPVFLVQELGKYPGDRPRQWRAALVTLGVAGLLVLAVGLVVMTRPHVRGMYTTAGGTMLGRRDWLLYLTVYRRMLLGVTTDAPAAVTRWHDALFWAPVLAVLGLGTWRLVAQRRWDRVALVVGAVATGLGFHLVCGATAIRPGLNMAAARYGFVLTVPTVLALACALRALLVEPTTAVRQAARALQWAGLAAVAAALLVAVKVNWFDRFASKGESVWTLRSDSPDLIEDTTALVDRVVPRSGRRGRARVEVITEGFWQHKPLYYLLLKRPDLRVVCRDDWKLSHPLQRVFVLAARLRAGAYVVSFPDDPLAAEVKALFPASALERWALNKPGQPRVVVLHLKPDSNRPPAEPVVAGRPVGDDVRRR